MHIRILWIGKTRNPCLESLCTDYLNRIQRFVSCDVAEVPDLSRRRSLHGEELRSAESGELERRVSEMARVVVLDAEGTELSSPDFAGWFQKERNRGTRDLVFVIGGPEGISGRIVDRADLRLSLGRMTWTHELARVLLLEQVYRAFSILQNTPYHK